MCLYHLFCATPGGSDKSIHTDRASVECYDPNTDAWTFLTEMDKGRSGLLLVAIDRYLFVIGGRARYLDRYYNWTERSRSQGYLA